MRAVGLASGVVATMLLATPSRAQQPTIEALMRRIDAMQHEIDDLKTQLHARPQPVPRAHVGPGVAEARPAQNAPFANPSPARVASAPAAAPSAATPSAATPSAAAPAVTAAGGIDALVRRNIVEELTAPIPGLRPPEPMGNQYDTEDALRSDLPGIAIRIPGTETQVRLYGFAKLSGWGDFNTRNQTDAPPPQTIPLADSAAAMQGGDFGMTARFSRFGIDTRTLTGWGTLETRLEGDFGGGAPTSSNAVFRLRQAWGEIGTDAFRVLVGQANSLWNEGVFETLIDATNLNQSFIRQAQLRATGRLAPGLTGMVSIEAPETQYTAVDGVFTPGANGNSGGASPAFNAIPDFLGRLTYRDRGFELDGRGLLRQLTVRTAGTSSAPPNVTRNTLGWGLAGMVRLPMRWLSDAFGPDQITGMGYYGQGIGRYFAGNTSGQDALSNIGLPGVFDDASLDAIPTYGVVAAYRRFWTTQLRSNVSYAYARQDYPSYASAFVPGTLPATSLNRDMQQVFVNLIWSPFATLRNGAVGTGWLDVGLEYLFTRRNVLGGSEATGAAGVGHGVQNRIVGAAVVRF